MGFSQYNVFYGIIVVFQLAVMVFGIVGLASTQKGWASASQLGITLSLGWQGVCLSQGGSSVCINYDKLTTGSLGSEETDDFNDFQHGGIAAVIGSILLMISGLAAIVLLTLAIFKVAEKTALYVAGTLITIIGSIVACTICWIVWIAITGNARSDSTADPDYALYLVAISTGLNFLSLVGVIYLSRFVYRSGYENIAGT